MCFLDSRCQYRFLLLSQNVEVSCGCDDGICAHVGTTTATPSYLHWRLSLSQARLAVQRAVESTMATGKVAEKAGSTWLPSKPEGPLDKTITRRHRSRPRFCGRNFLLFLSLTGALCFALFRASGLASIPVLSTSPIYESLRGGPDHVARPENKWAAASLPKGDWPKDQYLLGVGKADITGPVVELNMMGYADFSQIGEGCGKGCIVEHLLSETFIILTTASFTWCLIFNLAILPFDMGSFAACRPWGPGTQCTTTITWLSPQPILIRGLVRG